MEFVRREVRDHVAIVTLDRPPVNAINLQTYREVAEAFHAVGEDPGVRVAVFRAEGDRAFCAGNDLHDFESMTPDNAHERMGVVRDSFWSVRECAVPVIGAINGPALGTGLAYAAVCDLLVAAEDATFGLPEINVGVMGGAKHLSRLVPQMVVRYMHYTGATLSAEEMRSYGAVLRMVSRARLLDVALELAAELARKSPVALRFAKRSLNTIEPMELKEGYRFEQSLTAELSGHAQAKEALRAVVEKREPVFP